jgi:maltose O-acetyltransferase
MADDDTHDALAQLDPVRLASLKAMSAVVLGAYRIVRGHRLRVGQNVIANHRLIMKGPGTIELASRVNLFAFGADRRTRLITRRPEAVIRIGENSRLNGADIQADALVDIGPNCIIGAAHLLDTDMHSLARDRRTNPRAPVRRKPIVVHADVWIARSAAILPGVTIGEGSVVAYGAIVTADVPPGVVVAGNPARIVKEVE